MVDDETDSVWRTVVPTLEPLERRALAMIYLDGLTQRQVAQRLGAQRTAVAIAVARAFRIIAGLVEATTCESRQAATSPDLADCDVESVPVADRRPVDSPMRAISRTDDSVRGA